MWPWVNLVSLLIMLSLTSYIENCIAYLRSSPTAFHAATAAAQILRNHGWIALHEEETWNKLPAGRYFVLRNDSSLIAFTWQGQEALPKGLAMIGAHTDSPGLRLKPQALFQEHNCLQLAVEIYGGALLRPWFDRELSLAGRVCWSDADKGTCSVLVDFQRPVAIIPSLAIHLNREANKQQEVNTQRDLLPLVGLLGEERIDFQQILRQELQQQHPQVNPSGLLDHELFLYDPQPPALVGLGQEFLSAGRLDNLVSCFAALQALLAAESQQPCWIVLNDHEEVGSMSAVGAQGSFLRDIVERLFPHPEQRQSNLRRSLFISADNAHAVHPNHAHKHDPQHLPRMNGGLVIKSNANQRYASTALSVARFRQLCKEAQVPVQDFVMRNDLACGSTIGPLTAAALGVATVDVGIPSLAMHSIRETAACTDCWFLYRVLRQFFTC
jgi:aspartyl aminopeptidase